MSILFKDIRGKFTKKAPFMGCLFKCDACGRFISYDDIDSGRAVNKMITPDSDYSAEEWEILCKRCKDKEAIK